MKICENCPFKEEAELWCDGEEMMKICKYQAMCERVLEQKDQPPFNKQRLPFIFIILRLLFKERRK